MKLFTAILLWLTLPIWGVPVVILSISAFSAVPSLGDLEYLHGTIKQADTWHRSWGKGPRCGISLIIKEYQGAEKLVKLSCGIKNDALLERAGDEIHVWFEEKKWHHLYSASDGVYQLKVGDDFIAEYQRSAEFEEGKQPSRFIFFLMAFGMGLGYLYFIVWGYSYGLFKQSQANSSTFQSRSVLEQASFTLEEKEMLYIHRKMGATERFGMIALLALSLGFFALAVDSIEKGIGEVSVILIVFSAVGFMGFLVCINPRNFFVDFAKREIGRKDYLNFPYRFTDVSPILMFKMCKVQQDKDTLYYLIGQGENGRVRVWGSGDRLEVEKLLVQLADYLNVPFELEPEEISVTQMNLTVQSKDFLFLQGPIGFIFLSIIFFAAFGAVVFG